LGCMNEIMGKLNSIKNGAQSSTNNVLKSTPNMSISEKGSSRISCVQVENLENPTDSNRKTYTINLHVGDNSLNIYKVDKDLGAMANEKRKNDSLTYSANNTTASSFLNHLPSSFSPAYSRKDSGQFDLMKTPSDACLTPLRDPSPSEDNFIPSNYQWKNRSRSNSSISLFQANDSLSISPFIDESEKRYDFPSFIERSGSTTFPQLQSRSSLGLQFRKGAEIETLSSSSDSSRIFEAHSIGAVTESTKVNSLGRLDTITLTDPCEATELPYKEIKIEQ